MDWEDLKYALAVQRTGTLSGAGKQLGVARTTVGRRLDAMEERLGVRLFDRTPEGFVPTAAGDDLAETAATLEAQVHALEGRVLGRDAKLRGRLYVSMLDFVFGGFVDVFKSFRDRYPGVDLTIDATPKPVSLTRREADIVIRLADSPPPYLVGRRLGQVQFALYAHRSLVEQIGADAPLADYPWLNSDERNGSRFLDQWLAEHAPGAETVMRVSDYAVGRMAVGAGIGVHFLACFDADADDELVKLAPHLVQTSELWMLTLDDLRHNTRVRAFMDHVQAAFGERKDALEGRRVRGDKPVQPVG